ncbi:MAG: hypothetical protein ACQEQL_04750 [Pseudomonadota bacterium]
MTDKQTPDNKPEPKKWRRFLKGTTVLYPAAYSAITFGKTPALVNAGLKGVIGAAVIGFSTLTAMVLGGMGGGALGMMAAETVSDKLSKGNPKRANSVYIGTFLTGIIGGACAGYAAVHDTVKDEVLRQLPPAPETQTPETKTPEPREKPSGILDLSTLSDAANQNFGRDQVLMKTPTHALVLPAGYRARPAI